MRVYMTLLATAILPAIPVRAEDDADEAAAIAKIKLLGDRCRTFLVTLAKWTFAPRFSVGAGTIFSFIP